MIHKQYNHLDYLLNTSSLLHLSTVLAELESLAHPEKQAEVVLLHLPELKELPELLELKL